MDSFAKSVILSNGSPKAESLDSTLTWSSTALSMSGSEKIGNPPSASKFENFEIPWQKLPDIMKQKLELGQKIGNDINSMVHLLIADLRLISVCIPTSVLRQICAKLTAKYPESLIENDEDGIDIGFNHSMLLTKFINHNNYLNRGNSCSQNLPIKKRQLMKTVQKSCVNWQPSPPENSENIQQWKMDLISLSNINRLTVENWKTIFQLMDNTYAEQRIFLNQSPSTGIVKMEWPFLLKKECMFRHFNKLMDTDIVMFPENFRKKKGRLINYAKTIKAPETVKFLAITEFAGEPDISVFKLIYHYFKEDFDLLFKIYKVNNN